MKLTLMYAEAAVYSGLALVFYSAMFDAEAVAAAIMGVLFLAFLALAAWAFQKLETFILKRKANEN